MKKKIVIGMALSSVAILTFLTWYKIHYSMDVAESYEVNTNEHAIKVLIATQGSEFKDAVVDGVIDYLKQKPAYIKVIDVTSLPQLDEEQWSAVVVIHTWENLKPQEDAREYLESSRELSKVVVLTTSSDGAYKIEGVNAISSASEMADVAKTTSNITNQLEQILEGNQAGTSPGGI